MANATSGYVKDTVILERSPRAILILPNQNLLLVTAYEWGPSYLYVLEQVGHKLVKTIKVDDGPQSITMDPKQQTIYIPTDRKGLVEVVDPKTLSVKKYIQVGKVPVSADFNPNTKLLYVCNFGSSTVSVIDGITMNTVSTILVGTHPVDIAVNPKNNKVYVANSDSKDLSVIDGLSNKIVATVPIR